MISKTVDWIFTILKKVGTIAMIICCWVVTAIWLLLSFGLIVKGFITAPYLVRGVTRQMMQSAFEVGLCVDERILLDGLSHSYLTYVLISYMGLLSTLLMLCWKCKKNTETKASVIKTGIREKIVEVLNRTIKPETMKSLQGALRLCLYTCFLVVTILWCFYTARLTRNLATSRYGAESIIRQEAPSIDLKDQPLFNDSKIRGITFDHAANLISVVYLKYIGLVYLEALLFVLVVQRHLKKKKSKKSE